jgi:hypothetical protein
MVRRNAVAISTPFAESMAKTVSRNHKGESGGTSTSRRIGRGARRNSAQMRGGVRSSAHSRTESGNQKGAAAACLKDIAWW